MHRVAILMCSLSGVVIFIGMARNAVCDEPPVPSPSQLAAHLERMQRSLFADDTVLRIQYSRYSSEEITSTKFSGQLLPADWVVEHQYGSDWLTRLHFRLTETEIRETSGLPKQPIVHMLKDGMSLDWTPHIRRCVINPVDSSRHVFNVFQGWEYLRNAGCNPYRKILSSVGMDYSEAIQSAAITPEFSPLNDLLLPNCLEKHQEKYRVSRAVSPDGFQCWLVEWKGMDQIWLDESVGFAVRKRITHWREGRPVRREIRNSDFRKVQEGVWLPFEQVVDKYANINVEKENTWGKVANRSRYQLASISLADDKKGGFDIRLPVGTTVDDVARNVSYSVTAPNSNPFDTPQILAQPLLDSSRPGLRNVIIANCIGLVVAALAWCFRDRLRNFFLSL